MSPDLNTFAASTEESICHPARNLSITDAGDNGALDGRGSSPRSASTSLQAAAAVNAGLQHEDSGHSPMDSSTRNKEPSISLTNRRRSAIMANLQLNDPTIPAPGEMISEDSPFPNSQTTTSPTFLPRSFHGERVPSLGQIHQSIEEEQEAQVNRLLQMISSQQQHLRQLQENRIHSSSIVPPEQANNSSEYSGTIPSTSSPFPNLRSPALSLPRSPMDHYRTDFRHRIPTSQQESISPRLRSMSNSREREKSWVLGCRDENAFYQAETQIMIRENQMLRQRIKELERQLHDVGLNSLPHEPTTPSQLLISESTLENTAQETPEENAMILTQ
ncbi:hypothetical protein BGHDH14_bgh04821 [Blumeria hordei DH14]|uniref:Uncharacterized protein n=1 Tax=Blumeria graminis f. sp. hordei (strain DH14) TaxID=546991 RepID=N1JBN3_BLUG1|nr:hypothetical protein BGHDH14_bgh04821 [Blumeria hordei DH14]